MDLLMIRLRGLASDEQGASATEYSVLILLIILVALAAISMMGIEVKLAFDKFLKVFNGSK